MRVVNVLTLLLFTGLNSTLKLFDVHSANANDSVAPSTCIATAASEQGAGVGTLVTLEW